MVHMECIYDIIIFTKTLTCFSKHLFKTTQGLHESDLFYDFMICFKLKWTVCCAGGGFDQEHPGSPEENHSSGHHADQVSGETFGTILKPLASGERFTFTCVCQDEPRGPADLRDGLVR